MTNPRLVVDELVATHRLEVVPDDLPSANSRLERAIEKLEAAKAIVEIDVEIAYVSAYDATRTAITAHMLAAGFRARPIARAHEAVGDYAEAMIKTPSVGAFHAFRRRRNKAEYDDAIVSRADFDADLVHAEAIIGAVAAHLESLTDAEANEPGDQDQPGLDKQTQTDSHQQDQTGA